MTPCTAVRRMFRSTSGHERPLSTTTQDIILRILGCVEEPPTLTEQEAEDFIRLLEKEN